MRKNREIRDGKESIVEYEQIEHPITHELREMPTKITEVETKDEYEIAYEVIEDPETHIKTLKEHKTKIEKVTLNKIWAKLQELETKIDRLIGK